MTLSTIGFIKKARIKHGDKYDYSNVVYIGATNKVKIICKNHGGFLQRPSTHFSGSGCPTCHKWTTETFINKANKIHNFKYDYSDVNYIHNKSKVNIICKEHGPFLQIPNDHLSGHGCRACGSNWRTLIDFVHAANNVHEFKYDYSKVEYVKNYSNVEIICKEHGLFFQTPNNHVSKKSKCPSCANHVRWTTKTFCEVASQIHKNKYDYSKVVYEYSHIPIEIICPTHGSFRQTPSCHKNLIQGCPKCGSSISHMEQRWLDSLDIPNDQNHRQVWLYVSSPLNKKIKVDGFDPKTNTVYEFLGDYWHGNPKLYDLNQINQKTHTTFGKLFENTNNRLKSITNTGLKLVTIWASEWKQH